MKCDEDEDLEEDEIDKEVKLIILGSFPVLFISGFDRKLGFVGLEVCEIFREIRGEM